MLHKPIFKLTKTTVFFYFWFVRMSFKYKDAYEYKMFIPTSKKSA